jgi:hypothetical protein
MSLQILILAATGIILLIVLIRIYPLIHIGISRVIFGKYSSRYLATCKRYTGQSPYPYCIKDDFINYIAGFYKASKTLQRFESEKEIFFLETDFGLSFKNILNSNPKPFCINSTRLKQFDMKVLGYKDILFTSEMKKYFFFIDGKFFMGQLTFKNPDKENIAKIVGVIRKKYLDIKSIDLDSFIIYGVNNSILLCEFNGFHLRLSYLSRAMDDINELLDNYWDTSTKIEIGKPKSLESELMSKL